MAAGAYYCRREIPVNSFTSVTTQGTSLQKSLAELAEKQPATFFHRTLIPTETSSVDERFNLSIKQIKASVFAS